jgi:hypothetical protein
VTAAVDTLTKAGVEIKRDQWIKEAEDCEKTGYPTTCQALACVCRPAPHHRRTRKFTHTDERERERDILCVYVSVCVCVADA